MARCVTSLCIFSNSSRGIVAIDEDTDVPPSARNLLSFGIAAEDEDEDEERKEEEERREEEEAWRDDEEEWKDDEGEEEEESASRIWSASKYSENRL